MQTTQAGTNMKVLDFGMAKVLTPEAMGGLESAATLGGVMVLSPQYVTPEQLEKSYGSVGAWTDVYAFALIVVEALTARRARVAETFPDLMLQITQGDAPTPRRSGVVVSDAVESVFERALARDPKDRYPDLGTFWGALKAAITRPAPEKPDAPPQDFGSTVVMPQSRAHTNFNQTMPLSPRQSSVAPRPPFAGTMPLPAPQREAPPQPQQDVKESHPRPSPKTRADGRPVLVFFLVVFVALSLGASGLLFVQMLHS
jgi:serine/threonine protein kinase